MEKKKYFTKYLPVEGEIKEGDMTASKPDGAVVKVKTEGFAEVSNRLGGLKMKLFLCSRDIQVGDRVETIYGGKGVVSIINHRGIFIALDDFDYSSYIDNYHHYKAESVYKVIGEISPEATWVTEGMEFEEDQVKFLIASKFHSGYVQVSIKEYLKTEYDRLQIQIKGSCGHFH